ncbi:hypothetical protein D021_0732B, partial [Vibrio parahaemolyticus 10296]
IFRSTWIEATLSE